MTSVIETIKNMEFDSVFEVLENGTIRARDDLYSPTVFEDDIDSSDWVYWSHGYTQQYGYNGPHLANNENVSNAMADDMLSDTGIYVYTTCEYIDEDYPDETYGEGWTILKHT